MPYFVRNLAAEIRKRFATHDDVLVHRQFGIDIMGSVDDIHLMALGLDSPGKRSGDIQDPVSGISSKEDNCRSHNSPAYALML